MNINIELFLTLNIINYIIDNANENVIYQKEDSKKLSDDKFFRHIDWLRNRKFLKVKKIIIGLKLKKYHPS